MRSIRFPITLLLLVLFAGTGGAQTLHVGARGSWLIPLGTLSERFESAPGFGAVLRWEGPRLSWGCEVEYARFSRENRDELNVSDSVDIGGVVYPYVHPLSDLTMTLTIGGVSAQMRYELATVGSFAFDLAAGVGIYSWSFVRDPYSDSVFVDTPSGPVLAEALVVPGDTQDEWSGGFNVGFDVRTNLLAPVRVTAGAHYKAIVGEMWPALAIDLENVSTMQMVDLRLIVSIPL